jgi:YD repeat-containing protein
MLKLPPLLKDAEKLHAPTTTNSPTPATASLMRAPTISHAPAINFSLPSPSTRRNMPRPGQIHSLDVTVSSLNGTGINPWWTYEEGALPGTGKYMVNVGNGNIIVQSDDIDIPERGIDLAFQRTYNSMSLNDTNANSGNDDGSANENVYGNGWTNTFDAHVANNTTGGITVFDIDGARYDYSPNGTGCLTPPPGMYNRLCTDGGAGWLWYKKSGTIYYFYGPNMGGVNAGYAGRLVRIWARNNNNALWFNYYWANNDSSSSQNLTQLVVQHTDGQALTLAFGMVNGRPLLSSVTRPDGSQVTYSYSGAHDLVSVGKLGNNSASVLTENYGYYAADKIAWTSNPRWNLSGGADGSFTNFYYDGSNRVNGVLLYGFGNITPNDGTGTPIQPISTAATTIAYSTFSYPTSGETSLTDIDGHATNWFYDSNARVTQTQEWTGANENLWLLTNATWDSNNSLTETVDARGNATDYDYDSNGNTVAVAQPAVATNQGTFRPTALYSYDRTDNANNIFQYCDPVETHAIGRDWTTNPGMSDSLCPNQSGTTRYTWDYTDSAEPLGRMSNSYTPLGYHESYSYSSTSQGGDFGLPTGVTGDGFGELDNTFVTPQKSMTYDGYGNVTAYNTGNGPWSLTYDSMNRVIAVSDPDNVTSRTCYFVNGSVQATQSAAQYALDGGTLCGTHSISYTYDPNGNELNETHHYSGGNDVTNKWYDGEDRLVEVKLPASGQSSRYLYDLSQGATVSITGSSSFRAYGNLFATKMANGMGWQDSRGQAFDALDRSTVIYRYKPNGGNIYTATSAYDTSSSTLGMLVTTTDGLSEVTSRSYDAAGHITSISFSGDGGVTPARAYVFDADGRPTQITSSNGADTYVYDSSGRLTNTAQTNAGFSASTISYDYYPNGWRSDLNVSGPYATQTQLVKYSYRSDGERDAQVLSYAGNSWQFSWALSAAGRETSFADPFYARQKTYDSYGRLTSDNLEQGAYTAFTYNAEDGVTGYSAFRGQTANLSYDGVNQLLTKGFTPGGDLWPTGGPGSAGGPCTGENMVCDIPNGAAVSDYESSDNSGADWTRSKNWNYDNAGRQNVTTAVYDASAPCINPHLEGQTCYADGASTKATAFDAENHLLGNNTSIVGAGGVEVGLGQNASCPPNQEAAGSYQQNSVSPPAAPTVTPTVAYGPDGHVITDNGEQIYWDGGQPLFTVTSGGALDDIKVDGFAVYSAQQSQIAILDRDFSGTQVSQHNSTGYDAWGPQDPYHIICTYGPTVAGSTSYVGVTEKISQPGSDGIYDGTNTFQGARAYDPIAQQWTAPDAYAGDVRDPMSQKPYMWNRNNPLDYVDPSGYSGEDWRDSIEDKIYEDIVGAEFVNNDRDDAAKYWSKGNFSSARENVDDHMRAHQDEFHDDLGEMTATEITTLARGLMQQGTAGSSLNRNLRIGEKSNGSYTVYDSKTGNFGVFEANGEIISMQNLKAQRLSQSEINNYLKSSAGKAVDAIPCHRKP